MARNSEARMVRNVVASIVATIVVALAGLLLPSTPHPVITGILLLSAVAVLVLMTGNVGIAGLKPALIRKRVLLATFSGCVLAISVWLALQVLLNVSDSERALPLGMLAGATTFWAILPWALFAPNSRQSTRSLAATCIPIQTEGETITTFLIHNPNFDMWMFPGGHVDLDDAQCPADVARDKAVSEAGLQVELAQAFTPCDEYQHCKPGIAPQFVYALRIEKESACHRAYGHDLHVDLTHIGIVKRLQRQHQFERIAIQLPHDVNTAPQLRRLLSDAIDSHYKKNGRALPKQLFPEDIPARLAAAVQAFREMHVPRRA